MKFNHIIWLFIIITGFLNLQSTSAGAMVLEREAIISYKLETVSDNPIILKISGLSGHSAMAVNNITTRIEEKTLIIYINLILGPLKPKARGDFEYQLQIPDNIDTIQMGEKKVVIWERASGPATTKYKVDGPPPWLIEKNKTQTP